MFGHIFGPRSRLSPPEYLPLAHDVEGDDLGGLSKEPFNAHQSTIDLHAPLHQQTTPRGWGFFITACVIATILSAFNLSFLSVRQTLENMTVVDARARKTPTVYMGLENVKLDRQRCRGRTSFPKQFWTFDAGDVSTLKRVHAHEDKTSFAFGGDVSAQMEWYTPDFGLENCTLSANFNSDSFPSVTAGSANYQIDVFALKKQGDLVDRVFLDTLTFAPGAETRTQPFYCPSQSYMYFEWDCKHRDCWIQFPLQGVTDMTSSGESLAKTGFRMIMHEALECIGSPQTPL